MDAEELQTLLIEMGFERAAVLRVLSRTLVMDTALTMLTSGCSWHRV